jgi:hypothetical protein
MNSGATHVLELDHAVWVGGQVAIEWRDGPLSFKALSGIEMLANSGDASCASTNNPSNAPDHAIPCSSMHWALNPNVFFSPIGIAIGYAF